MPGHILHGKSVESFVRLSQIDEAWWNANLPQIQNQAV